MLPKLRNHRATLVTRSHIIDFPTLKSARKAFVKSCLKNERVALIRECGLQFETTFHNPETDSIIKEMHNKFTDVQKFLKAVL